MATSATVHQLKVTLRRVKPPVWRRVVVPSDLSLAKLSRLLELTMGWYGGHLHAFEADGVSFGVPDLDWGDRLRDERRARLADVLPGAGAKMRWDYDFGDGWEHDVVVEAILDRDPKVRYPTCIAGRRACPPEDCGGPYGYADMLDALRDSRHPSHEEFRDWVPPGFKPSAFDLAGTDSLLR